MTLYAASCDDPETNRKFAESLDLDYPILSDPGCKTARAYGAAGPDATRADRVTFYIGPDGKLLAEDRSVKPSTAGEDIAARLEALGVKIR